MTRTIEDATNMRRRVLSALEQAELEPRDDVRDLANFSHQDEKPLPGVAPVALQQGRYVAKLIARRQQGKTSKPFRYKDRGSMAVIGRSAAVADLGWLRFSGFFAWLIWLLVHLVYLVKFQNRILVLIQWGWNYITRNRSARLITTCSPRENDS